MKLDQDAWAIRTHDRKRIRSLMAQMGPTVAEDAVSIARWFPNIQSTCWLQVYIDSELIALHKLEALNATTVEFHANVLPAHRARHRHQAVRAAFRWLLDECPSYEKVNVTIPVVYPHIRHFARQVGFQDEGLDRHSFRVGGRIVDRWRMGITAPEMRIQAHGLAS